MPLGVGEPGLLEELPDRQAARQPRRERPEGGDDRLAMVRAQRGREMEGDVEPVRRQQRVGAIRPLEQRRGALDCFLEPELDELPRLGDAIEVGMHQRE